MAEGYTPRGFGAGISHVIDKMMGREQTQARTDALKQNTEIQAEQHEEWRDNAAMRKQTAEKKIEQILAETEVSQSEARVTVATEQAKIDSLLDEAAIESAKADQAVALAGAEVAVKQAKAEKERKLGEAALIKANKPTATANTSTVDDNPHNDWRAGMGNGELSKLTGASEKAISIAREKNEGYASVYQAANSSLQLLAQPDIDTGALTPIKQKIGGLATSLDIPLPNDWNQAGQEEVRTFMRGVLQHAVQNSPRLSDKDLEVLREANADERNTTVANQRILRYNRTQAQHQMEKYDFILDRVADGGLYKIAEAEWKDMYPSTFPGLRVLGRSGEIETWHEFQNKIKQRDTQGKLTDHQIRQAWMAKNNVGQ